MSQAKGKSTVLEARGYPKASFEGNPVPKPNRTISGTPFFPVFSENEPKMGVPFFRKIAEQVALRRPKTASKAEHLKKTGFRKGGDFGTSSGTYFNPILRLKSGF